MDQSLRLMLRQRQDLHEICIRTDLGCSAFLRTYYCTYLAVLAYAPPRASLMEVRLPVPANTSLRSLQPASPFVEETARQQWLHVIMGCTVFPVYPALLRRLLRRTILPFLLDLSFTRKPDSLHEIRTYILTGPIRPFLQPVGRPASQLVFPRY
jgi:hypothetical protein